MNKQLCSIAIAASVSSGLLVGCVPNVSDDGVNLEYRKRNIIYISTDQESYFQDYNFPGGTQYEARQLLAEMGTTFEKHYTCSNMSTSSRSVMYTGQHIPQTGMLDNTESEWQGPLDPDMATVGDMMRDSDYYSAYKGKWHMSSANMLEEDVVKEELTTLEEYGFSDWQTSGDYIGHVWEGFKKDPIISADTSQWLTTKGVDLNKKDETFFLAVNLVNPHDVMNYTPKGTEKGKVFELAGAPEDDIYKKTYEAPLPSSWNQPIADQSPAVQAFAKRWGAYTEQLTAEKEWKSLRDYYYNCIQDSDNNLMTILDTLKSTGLLDNTIIIFTTDHGDMASSHGLKGKGGFVYENNIHIPLIVVHPDVDGGQSCGTVTSHIDLVPTIVDLANGEKEEAALAELPGKSLVPILAGTASKVREGALFCYEMLSFSQVVETDAQGKSTTTLTRGFARAIITERYKFARYFAPDDFNAPKTFEELTAHNDLELFDLEKDPGEMVNLAKDPTSHRALILKLNEELNTLIEEEIGEDSDEHFKAYLAKQ